MNAYARICSLVKPVLALVWQKLKSVTSYVSKSFFWLNIIPVMLVGLNPISTLGLNLRNGLSKQNSEVTTGKEIIFYVDPPGVEFTKNYSSPSYRAAKILSRVGSTPGSTPGRPQIDSEKFILGSTPESTPSRPRVDPMSGEIFFQYVSHDICFNV